MRLTDRFDWGRRTYVMGILNVTPDSFSGDGLVGETELVSQAVYQARDCVENGADILDIGGESTRPGSEPVTEAAELDRVLPAVTAIREALPDIAISIDTYRSAVADAALRAGADMINDVWGLRADPELASVAAARGVPVVLMHNRSKPGNAEIDARLGGRYIGADYDDLLEDISRELLDMAETAQAAGIDAAQIILDPGVGFGKSVSQNLALINCLEHFKALGFPVLVGPSRKSFIGHVLDLPVEERLEGTAAAVSMAVARGADIVRVHDVAAMSRVVRMTEAIVGATAETSLD